MELRLKLEPLLPGACRREGQLPTHAPALQVHVACCRTACCWGMLNACGGRVSSGCGLPYAPVGKMGSTVPLSVTWAGMYSTCAWARSCKVGAGCKAAACCTVGAAPGGRGGHLAWCHCPAAPPRGCPGLQSPAAGSTAWPPRCRLHGSDVSQLLLTRPAPACRVEGSPYQQWQSTPSRRAPCGTCGRRSQS